MMTLLLLAGVVIACWLLAGLSLNNYISGHRAGVAFFTQGEGGATVLQVKSQTLDEDGLIFDVSNTGTGGRTARIAGKADHKGTVNADFDADAPPYLAPPAIRFGTLGIIMFFFQPSKPIQIPVIVTKTHFESAIESEIRYSFECAENVLAGVIVYPAVPGV